MRGHPCHLNFPAHWLHTGLYIEGISDCFLNCFCYFGEEKSGPPTPNHRNETLFVVWLFWGVAKPRATPPSPPACFVEGFVTRAGIRPPLLPLCLVCRFVVSFVTDSSSPLPHTLRSLFRPSCFGLFHIGLCYQKSTPPSPHPHLHEG